ncbi:A-kinase anchor protein 17A [Halotydeus destructor]|nr:A-kinase anchor protein 17A [Halotydeus destructor]
MQRPSTRDGYTPLVCNAKQSDLKELNDELGLYLKPIAKMSINVVLPLIKEPGQCISTWEVMERLKKKARPHDFRTIKITKSSLEFIRFEAECASRHEMDKILPRLDKGQIKLAGFADSLKVHAGQLKVGQSRHDWESFFRDNPNMNEMKAGYRPDTIHIKNLPVKWLGGDKPKTKLLVHVFGVFGDIKRFHVPCLDELTEDDDTIELAGSSGFKKFTHSESLQFEAYIMYRDYIGFVKAMDSLKGMKLVKKLSELNKFLEYDIEVDFDKTKHLSDKAIKRRKLDSRYGIKNNKDLRQLKADSRVQRIKFEERVKLLTDRKEGAISLVKLLMVKVEEKEGERKAKEEKLKVEEKLKLTLLKEESKLREKLLEARREHLRKKLANEGKHLSSVASVVKPKSHLLSSHNSSHDHHRHLHKDHKPKCKHYKTKSVVIKKS